ncbi:aminopeptidase P family N-terminal domain-containing protein [Candidatus Anaplasma sp. TIGMIC]|uniref:aminopeptidase P family N-terminal domain-containing protein n=1 Tax=Candidatus Anaplasma sp. TIGMIC TaxID=3020713 RepID=UPI00232D41E7|nr:aminopeptidase P family N-terminal domain-containing protein [Candidatus Anaplasma sp. TIGMIC]
MPICIGECFQRIRWLCGFTGSHAQVIICKEGRCKFFTDSRYTIQAALEADSAYFDIYDISDTSVASWLEVNLQKEALIGYYGELFILHQVRRFERFDPKIPLVAGV